jgi:cytidylate kinase
VNARSDVARIVAAARKEWAFPPTKPKGPTGPVIVVSRQPGAGGEAIGRMLARRLGLEFYDREIVEMIARDAMVSEAAVASHDEKVRSELDHVLAGMVAEGLSMPSHRYLAGLRTVILSIAARGGAVIVGRGANFILPPKERLSIRLVASRERRQDHWARRFGLSARAARKRLAVAERQQRRFIKRYFGTDPEDPLGYDLTINTARLGPRAILRTVKAVLGLP